MYGTKPENETDPTNILISQRNQIDAAMVLINNLQSNDIIDLVQAAINYHDKLCVNKLEEIGLHQIVTNHVASGRKRVVEKKWNYLNSHYNGTQLKDPDIAPNTIQEFLVKFMWLSYYQLPANPIKTAEYLNWELFQTWMQNVIVHSHTMII